jgi:signal transduction histidine kinase
MISRADSGAIRLHLRELNPGDLVQETVSLPEPLAEEKGQTISIDDGARVMMTADPVLLRQALMNILHNAIKYSPPAWTIAVSVAAEDARTISVSVRDSDPGIAPEHAERISIASIAWTRAVRGCGGIRSGAFDRAVGRSGPPRADPRRIEERRGKHVPDYDSRGPQNPAARTGTAEA